ncbi:MAG: hypothetical protein AB8G18_02345 [Gammaproteobacteria bacterium]
MRAGLLVLAAFLAACASKPPPAPISPVKQNPIMPVNYGGSWERNYSRGGDMQENITRLARQLNRNSPGGSSANGRRNAGFTSSSPSLGPIISMARLAETITRSDTLVIEHDIEKITVDRQEDFALTCEFGNSTAQYFESTLGKEICGWDGQKMAFHVALPDGLTITHRLTLSPNGKELHVATTLTSAVSSIPYTLNRFYHRFEPIKSAYECKQTLSRKKVCWKREASE